jgi:dolichyl-phosphate-mannose--protein O-mannosyl transferase
LDSPHPYASQAYTWLLQLRPTSFYWATGEDLANYPQCARLADCSVSVNSLGNPFLWWLGTLAVLVAVVLGIIRRDWRAWAALSGLAFGWLPWLLYPERTTFTFYSIAFLPWVIFTLCYVFSVITQYEWGRITTYVSLTAIAIVSIFFYPVWVAMPIERNYWQTLMWLRSWI